MTRNDEGGIDLEPVEVNGVARHLCTELLRNAVGTGLVTWEDVPYLSERSWNQVVLSIALLAENSSREAALLAQVHDIDVAHLMEQIR